MLFNYHVKEMFRQCAFFLPKEKKPRTEKKKKEKRLREAQCEDHTAPTEVGTVTYCTLEETDGPSETEEAVKKEQRNMQASSLVLMSKASPFTLGQAKRKKKKRRKRIRLRKHAQKLSESAEGNKMSCKTKKKERNNDILYISIPAEGCRIN